MASSPWSPAWQPTAVLPPCALQETLDNLRKAMRNTRIMCAVMLDTKVRPQPACSAFLLLDTSSNPCLLSQSALKDKQAQGAPLALICLTSVPFACVQSEVSA